MNRFLVAIFIVIVVFPLIVLSNDVAKAEVVTATTAPSSSGDKRYLFGTKQSIDEGSLFGRCKGADDCILGSCSSSFENNFVGFVDTRAVDPRKSGTSNGVSSIGVPESSSKISTKHVGFGQKPSFTSTTLNSSKTQ